MRDASSEPHGEPHGEKRAVCAHGHTRCKKARDLAPRDVVMFFGTPHVIDRIEPYNGPHEFIFGIARASDGWGISLEETTCLEVG